MLLGVDRDGGFHILHLLLSVPVGPCDIGQRLFGCCGELPPKGLTAITKIPVASFGARRAVSDMYHDDHRVHLEGFSPFIWNTTPCERDRGKGEGRSLS